MSQAAIPKFRAIEPNIRCPAAAETDVYIAPNAVLVGELMPRDLDIVQPTSGAPVFVPISEYDRPVPDSIAFGGARQAGKTERARPTMSMFARTSDYEKAEREYNEEMAAAASGAGPRVAPRLLRDSTVAELYDELLGCVGDQWSGGTRHSTALRYIREGRANYVRVSGKPFAEKAPQ